MKLLEKHGTLIDLAFHEIKAICTIDNIHRLVIELQQAGHEKDEIVGQLMCYVYSGHIEMLASADAYGIIASRS